MSVTCKRKTSRIKISIFLVEILNKELSLFLPTPSTNIFCTEVYFYPVPNHQKKDAAIRSIV